MDFWRKIKKSPIFYSILLLGRILPDKLIADKLFLKLLFKNRLKKNLNLEEPTTYNEKLQWLKLYDHNPEYITMVDKYEVKQYVQDTIGKQYIIPTIGIWEKFEDIDFDQLPNQFVIKCTHDSGGVVICKDKRKLDKKKARKKINKSLRRNYYLNTREWPYKHVKPRIIIEKYMENPLDEDLKDYKFFIFNGTFKAMFIATDRNSQNETNFDFYDSNFNHLPFKNGHPNSDKPIRKPENFEKMFKLAEKLAEGLPHVRVDFYEIDNEIYFGEMTFYHWSGLKPFEPEEWDYRFGSWLKLPKNNLYS
ncbi:glycosyl transferase [Tetragenococcus muriaticus]|nr:glycosyl transferase [Tetragenococcus muriaticus]GMA46289.1 glycosyl transferase [Tetragenococcus muriaticus]